MSEHKETFRWSRTNEFIFMLTLAKIRLDGDQEKVPNPNECLRVLFITRRDDNLSLIVVLRCSFYLVNM